MTIATMRRGPTSARSRSLAVAYSWRRNLLIQTALRGIGTVAAAKLLAAPRGRVRSPATSGVTASLALATDDSTTPCTSS